jgi:hypothetical protein
MFTWICPQCGREVPPSYTECPDCAKKAAEPQPDPRAAPPPPPQTAPLPYTTTPPQHPQFQQPQPQYAPPPPQYMPPPPRSGLPTWAMAIVFALAIFGVVAGVYWLVGSQRGATTGSPLTGGPAPAVESPAAKAGARTNPYQKFIEIAGVRFVEDARKKPQIRFVLVNHSNADIPGLAGNVTVWGSTRHSEEDAQGSFSFTTDLKGYETKDITVPFTTKKKIYELPDWQNVSTDIQITAP